MIGYLQGKIIDLSMQETIVLTQSGVGYTVLINEVIYSQIALHENTEFFIYHHKTENSESLFGFLTSQDKGVFSELIKISGVGGKVAMLILSLGVDKLIGAIQMADNKTIEGIKGIGKKMAEKIILELKDKDFVKNANIVETKQQKNAVALPVSVAVDIKNTLTNMGYSPADVDAVLQTIPEDLQEVGEILPYCIRQLS